MLDAFILAAEAARATATLGLFLTAAFWLAELGAQAGLVRRAGGALIRVARGRAWALYLLVCTACAALTATVSLDGAVVLVAPVVAELGARSEQLRSALALGSIGVANAFSLALPEGNPTNVLVAARLGLGPADFVAHLAPPALLATVVCAGVPAMARRQTLASRLDQAVGPRTPLSRAERLAAAALGLAAAGELAAPWFGVAPWWPLSAVAALAYAGSRGRRRGVPPPTVPWRLLWPIGCLAVVAGVCSVVVPSVDARSVPALVGLALAAAAVAAVINNLPASVVLSGVIGSSGPTAFATLTGLSVGALATPRGSVATTIVLDRSGAAASRGYLRLWIPTALTATVAAVLLGRLL